MSRRAFLRRASLSALGGPVAGLLAACAAGEPGGVPDTTDGISGNPGRAEVLVLHHALGLTAGVRAFSATLQQAGHTVHTPDLYEGNVFVTLDEGLAYANEVGVEVIQERGVRAADELPTGTVYIGFSLGVRSAQKLAQTRAGARGAVFLEAFLPPSEFDSGWPTGVPVQVHGMDADPFFAGEGDVDAARALVGGADDGELFLYAGDQHLFTDDSLPTYDAAAAVLVTERVLAFLTRI